VINQFFNHIISLSLFFLGGLQKFEIIRNHLDAMSVLLVLGLASLTRTLADGPSTETTESTTRSDGPSCGCSTTSFVLVYGAAWVSTCFNPGCLGGLSRPWGRPWGFVIRIAFFLIFDVFIHVSSCFLLHRWWFLRCFCLSSLHLWYQEPPT